MKRLASLLLLPTLIAPAAAPAGQSSLAVDVNLVNVFATVQDESGRYVGGLGREDFRILEDGRERPIEIFAAEELTASVGILLDNSGSSADVLDSLRSGVLDFASSLGPEDEVFVMAFATEAQIVHRFTQDFSRLEGALGRLRAWGTSVFYDALDLGIAEVARGRHERRALVVLSDGNDNGSVKTYRDIVAAAQGSTVLLYFVALGPRVLVDTHTLEGLASMSGGRVILQDGGGSVESALAEIREELRHQYYLGYHASPAPGYHSLRVEVPGRSFTVRARDGYRVD